MRRRVIVQRLADDDLEDYYLWAARWAPETAARWLDRFHTALQTLADNPERCALAPENGQVTRELRQLLLARAPTSYRAVFTIDGDAVRILRIRRATRRVMTKRELEE